MDRDLQFTMPLTKTTLSVKSTMLSTLATIIIFFTKQAYFSITRPGCIFSFRPRVYIKWVNLNHISHNIMPSLLLNTLTIDNRDYLENESLK